MMNPYKDFELKPDWDRIKLTERELVRAQLLGPLLTLDADRENPLSSYLKEQWAHYDPFYLKGDFDNDCFDYVADTFYTVYSFEVLEHLMNPRWYLREVARVLKPEGSLILTTPVSLQPRALFEHHKHFHEMRRSRIETLFELSGLKIIEMKKMRLPLWRALRGVRPFVRWLFGNWWWIVAKELT